MQCNGIREHITYITSNPGFLRLRPGYTRYEEQTLREYAERPSSVTMRPWNSERVDWSALFDDFLSI